ncbi:hypothetical protein SLEP1_g43979 [Rubroshorea leprosula]|uniref:Reverse transcriptase Ty1/copia-type domain-containing protein n=1 Tax=Rubroshorea leprosula TaxID=152421 RepID=A0AAV5LF41_9ROSI|nr:hypothetical protein SLEP1_g43979 [Rubroshorea leprosula]
MPSTGPTCPSPPFPGPTSHHTTTPTSPITIAPTSLLPISASIVPSSVSPPAVFLSPFLPNLHSPSPSCGAAPPASAGSGSGPDISLSAASIGDCTSFADCSVFAPASASSSSITSFSSANVPQRTYSMVTRSQANVRKPKILPSLLHTSIDLQEPRTFKQACNLSEWQQAMQEEFLALQRNQTWVLVSPPSSANIVGSKWPGIDYDETFSPVVKPITIRTVLTLALSKSWPIHQLDVKNAFLNGYLSEPVYMSQPPGFVDPQYPDRAYSDCSMFLYRSNASFNPDGLFLCQTKYIFDLLARTGMFDCNAAATPLSPRQKLAASDSPPYLDSTKYRSIVGALQYLTFTRPDIAFAVHQVCQYMHAPTQNHFQNTVARSSAEAEYCAMANAVAEVVWVQQLLAELHVFLSSAPIVLCDNINALYLALNPIQHQRTKHIEIDIHFVQERVASRAILLQHVPSSLQCADILTKALSSTAFCSQRSNLCMLHQPAQIAGR